MELVLRVVGPAGRGLDVRIEADEGTPLSAVLPALTNLVGPGPQTRRVWVGGHEVLPATPLGQEPLRHGAELRFSPAPKLPPPGLFALDVVGGPNAGTRLRVGPEQLVIGRAADCDLQLDDPALSRRHATVQLDAHGLTIRDLNSTNGTQVDGVDLGTAPAVLPSEGVLRLGESSLALATIATVPAATRATTDGYLAHNRPPRWRPPVRIPVVTVPVEPLPRPAARFPVLAVLLPLLLGGVMALLVNPMYLLFVLLSPVMVVGTVLSDRRSGRKGHQRELAAYRAALVASEQAVTAAVADDERCRRRAAPDPAALVATALGPLPRLWERRRHDDDVLALRVGLTDQPARVERSRPAGEHSVAPLPPLPPARSVPVVVPLPEVGVLGLAGPRERTRASARALLLQAAVLHSPRDLRVVVLSAGGDGASPAGSGWEWARWLPHVAAEVDQDCRALLGLRPDQVRRRVAELVTLLAARSEAAAHSFAASSGAGPRLLVVLDGAGALRAVPGVADLLSSGPRLGVHAVCLDDEERLLPEECGAVAVYGGQSATRLSLSTVSGDRLDDIVADGVSEEVADRAARALAPVRDASPVGGGQDLPLSVRWTEVAGLPLDGTAADARHLVARWQGVDRTKAAPVGVGRDGVLALDLQRDGPHALVAGTTGAGKSELLQTLVAGLAAGNPPDRLTFVLVDYKGGAAFGPCAELPHTVGLVTDLDGALAARALESLGAELRRREALLAGAGATDIEGYWAATGSHAEPLARLVLIVDEFATLAEELPDFVGGLVGIAQRGRSLGVHLVLATQRPEGVVSADIRANTNLRLCLAVTRDTESRDVLDATDAARISRRTPGRAIVRTGHADLTPFQTARVGGRRPEATGPRPPTVQLDPAQLLGDPRPRPTAPPPANDERSDLDLLVAAAVTAARTLGIRPPASPWLPALPPIVALADLIGGAVTSSGCCPESQERAGRLPVLPLGLQDLPARQARVRYVLELARGGHLLVVGTPRSGRSTALRTLAGAVCAVGISAADLHLYAVDCGSGALLPLVSLPHCGAVVSRDQPDRLDRLLNQLTTEVARRQALFADLGHADLIEQRAAAAPTERLPWLMLLLDRWEGFLASFEEIDGGRYVDAVQRLLREGPAVGLKAVVTADRGGLVGRTAALLEERLVLRLADRGDFSLAGVPTAAVPATMPAGRCLQADGAVLTQVALLGQDAAGAAQVRALQALAREATRRDAELPGRARPARIDPLPLRVSPEQVEALRVDAHPPHELGVTLGVGGDRLGPLDVDLTVDGPGFVVAGPPRSGRSTLLLTVAAAVLAGGRQVVVLTPRVSPLRELAAAPGVLAVLTGSDAPAEAVLAALARAQGPVVLLVDDGELLVDRPIAAALETFLRAARDRGDALVVSGTTDELQSGYRGYVVDARRSRCGVLLTPQSATDGDLLGLRLPRSTGGAAPPGRGLLARRGLVTPLQVSITTPTAAISGSRAVNPAPVAA